MFKINKLKGYGLMAQKGKLLLIFFLCMLIGGQASLIEAVSPLEVSSRVAIEDEYLALKELSSTKRLLEMEANEEALQKVDGDISHLKNQLRTSLFRQYETILQLYRLRGEIFAELLYQKSETYHNLRGARSVKDTFTRERVFEDYQILEIKVSEINKVIKNVQKQIYKERAKERFTILHKKYKKSLKRDIAEQVAIKREIYFLLRQVAVTFYYPDEIVERIDKKINDADELLKVYSYWENTEGKEEDEWVLTDEREHELILPVGAFDHTEMDARRDYMDKVTTRENDNRQHDLKHDLRKSKSERNLYGDNFRVLNKVYRSKKEKKLERLNQRDE